MRPSPNRPSSHEQVQKVLELASEADKLEDQGNKKGAVLKLADACAIMFEEALIHPSLKPHLEKLLLRAERLKAESIWESRVSVKTLYDSEPADRSASANDLVRSPGRTTAAPPISSEEPKGNGTFVSNESHPSFPLVKSLMTVLASACLGDAAYPRAAQTLAPQLLVDCSERFDLDEVSALIHYPHVFRHLRVSTFGLSLADSIGRFFFFFFVFFLWVISHFFQHKQSWHV
jgi:hypothetical protein